MVLLVPEEEVKFKEREIASPIEQTCCSTSFKSTMICEITSKKTDLLRLDLPHGGDFQGAGAQAKRQVQLRVPVEHDVISVRIPIRERQVVLFRVRAAGARAWRDLGAEGGSNSCLKRCKSRWRRKTHVTRRPFEVDLDRTAFVCHVFDVVFDVAADVLLTAIVVDDGHG